MNTFKVMMLTVVMTIAAIPLHSYGQDSAEVVTLSPEVGNVIDAAERDEYGFFQTVENFSSAVIMKLPDGRFMARITVVTSSGQEVRSMEMPEARVYRYAEKIENFDEMKAGTYVPDSNIPPIFVNGKKLTWALNPQASQIHGGEQEAKEKQINKKDVKVTVTARNGEQYTGTIVFAADSALVIWRSSEPYNADKLNEWAVQLHSSEIERIGIEREGHFWSGVGYGLLAGGGTGALIGLVSGNDEGGLIRLTAGAKAFIFGIALAVPSAIIGGVIGAAQGTDDDFVIQGHHEIYLRILSKLKENAIFHSIPPYELRKFLSQKKEESSSHPLESLASDPSRSPEPSAPRFHLSVGEAIQLTGSARNDMIGAFTSSGFGGTVGGWFGPTTYPVDYSKHFSWNVAAEYSLTDHVQLGIARNSFPRQEIEGKDFENEYADGTSYSVLCTYVPVPAAPQLASRFEFAMAAGMSYNSLYVGGTVSSIFGSAYIQNPTSFTVDKHVLGLQLRASYDYYFSRYFSIQGKIDGKLLPSVNVPAVSYTNPLNGEGKVLLPHSVNFSGVDFSLGVRCHL